MSRAASALMIVALLWGEGQAGSSPASSPLEEKVRTLEEKVRQLMELVRALQRKVGEKDASNVPHPSPPGDRAPTSQKGAGSGQPLHLYWKDGVRMSSEDGSFRLKLGGRIMNDWAVLEGDQSLKEEVGPLPGGTEFRRARFYLSGRIYDRVEFKAQYDFAGGDADFKDVYLGLRDLPALGTLRVGHFKEPFALEELTSSKYITFMERSLHNVFSPSRNTGLLFQNSALDERLRWALGAFRDGDAFGDNKGNGGYNFTARVSGLPWYRGEGNRLLHLGLSYSHRNPHNNQLRLRERPEAHLAPNFVDTGLIAARSQDLLGFEAALVRGPFSLQGEITESFVSAIGRADPRFSGFYVEGSYFLTGEHRVYDRSEGAFGRVRPHSNFLQHQGRGAWQLAARFSRLDLSDAGIEGGEVNNFTFGVNWHLNPNTRVMWNYVFSDPEGLGEANIAQTRFQIDF
ncbi:MAG: porin [Acidobacteriota bacterium]